MQLQSSVLSAKVKNLMWKTVCIVSLSFIKSVCVLRSSSVYLCDVCFQADLILPSTALPLARKVKELVDDQCFTSVPNCHLGDLLTRGFLQSTGCRSSDSLFWYQGGRHPLTGITGALLAMSLARSDGDVVAIAAGRLVIHCSPGRYAQLGLPGRASRFGPKKERYGLYSDQGL